jgi:hypothetical protein
VLSNSCPPIAGFDLFKGHYYFTKVSSSQFVFSIFKFFNGILAKSRLGFYFKQVYVSICPCYLSIGGFLGMVFKHL